MSSPSGFCHQFSLTEIRKATDNFDRRKILGRGGEGFVYLAEICLPRKKTKTPVAVKQLNPNSREFEKEIQTISEIQHPNLVALLGYCKEPGQKILIYEYMENGCLSDYVKKKRITTCLSWTQRLNICIGAARGLQHLHTPTDKFPYGIIHRDIKPANILLNGNWVAKVSDFGMAKLSQVGQTNSVMKTGLRGTSGYYAPEYLMHSKVSRKIDVYALGVVLFEVLCRKKPWDREDESYYPGDDDDDLGVWAQENVDAEIEAQISGDSLDVFTNIIGRSLKQDPSRRPTMDEVVLDLENVLKFQEQADERVDPNSIPSEESEAKYRRLAESIDKIALDICEEGLTESSIEELNFIQSELKKAASDLEGSSIDDLLKVVDRLVSCLTTKATKLFDFYLRGGSSRSCKYVLNVFFLAFENQRLAHAVKESNLESLVMELLVRMADRRAISVLDSGTEILKALNSLMLKIVVNYDFSTLIKRRQVKAPQTSVFVILINLLNPPDPSVWAVSPSSTDESFATRRQEFAEIVVKCLIKLTKALESTLEDIDLDRLLQSLHLYWQELGTEEISRRAAADDRPLRMAKTIIFHLIKLRGNAIKGHLSLVPMEPQPIILEYIDLTLQLQFGVKLS